MLSKGLGCSLFLALVFSCISCGREKERGATLMADRTSSDPRDAKISLWRELPIRLVYSENFVRDFTAAGLPNPREDNPFFSALREWDQALPERELFDYNAFIPVPNGSFQRGDGVSGIYKLYDWDFEGIEHQEEDLEPERILAAALPGYFIPHDDYDELLEVDILFNYEHNQFDMEQLRFVFLHEVGHLMGLMEHEEDPNILSVMVPGADFDYFTGPWHITPRDRRALRQLYLEDSNHTAAQALRGTPRPRAMGVVALYSDGQCRHYRDGVQVYGHRLF